MNNVKFIDDNGQRVTVKVMQVLSVKHQHGPRPPYVSQLARVMSPNGFRRNGTRITGKRARDL